MAKSKKTLQSDLEKFKVEARNPIHSFHRYFGKLIPAIPAFAIENYSSEGDYVLDPFSGSGTTVVEAHERNRIGVGVDLNPLASLVAKVKTTYISETSLNKTFAKIMDFYESDKRKEKLIDPYVVNMDHWYRPEVKQDLLYLQKAIISESKGKEKDFFIAVFSAFMRGVSNADPMHVFPGYSKRMRRLDEEGRKIDVKASYVRAVKKRILQVSKLRKDSPSPLLFTNSFTSEKLNIDKKINLVVTNPPYISSIRYLETMKLEMGWLGFFDSQKGYLDLDKSVIGTERFYKAEIEEIGLVGYKKIDDQIQALRNDNPKMAKTVYEYFKQMEMVIKRVSTLVVPGGHFVIKISDSKVRTELIATHAHFIDICAKNGFKLLVDMIDEFDPNSRSLLTSRNSYSGIMTFDHVMIFQKK
jgi:DNA modification methylase